MFDKGVPPPTLLESYWILQLFFVTKARADYAHTMFENALFCSLDKTLMNCLKLEIKSLLQENVNFRNVSYISARKSLKQTINKIINLPA